MTRGRAPFRFGISGCRRGASLTRVAQQLDDITVSAAFDPDPGARERFRNEFPHVRQHTDFTALLDSGVDVVYIAAPTQYHAPQAIAALAAGVHVLSEVPAVVSLEQAHALVGAVRQSSAEYMLAENYCYTRDNLVVTAMIGAGLFGELYFAEGEFIQDMRAVAARVGSWQRHWHLGRNAVTYPTHTLGPLLRWLGTRVVAVAATGSGRHTEHPMENTLALTARTDIGALLRMRVDMLSPRPAERFYYALQGTSGAFEAGRGGAPARVHIAGRSPAGEWEPLDRYRTELMAGPPAGLSARSGSPLLPAHAFVDALRRGAPAPIDVYQALDMTLPGLISEQSTDCAGAWVAVPDPRHFTDGIGCDETIRPPRTR